jgi:dienelactone hydrolase
MSQIQPQTLEGRRHQHQLFATPTRRSLLVYSTWAGISEFEQGIARKLQALGWNVWLIDLYGQDTDLSGIEQRAQAMSLLLQDFTALRQRLQAFVEFVKTETPESCEELAVMGYCLGGLCAIQSTLCVPEISRGVSLHGLLSFPKDLQPQAANKALLILNGAADPMVPDSDLLATRQYLNQSTLDWTLVDLGHALHSFAIPGSHNPALGVAYDARSEARSWQYLTTFLSD